MSNQLIKAKPITREVSADRVRPSREWAFPQVTSRRRRWLLYGTPAAFFVTSVLHLLVSTDTGNNLQGFRDDASLFLGIHLVQLLLIWLLAWVMFELLRGLFSRPARLARSAIVPFAILLTAFDSAVGIASGLLAKEVNALPVDQVSAGANLLERYGEAEFGPVLLPIVIATGIMWLIWGFGTAFAVRAAGKPKAAFVALLVAGVMFVSHAPPTGPIGMLALLVAISSLVWSERKARVEEPHTVRVPTQGN